MRESCGIVGAANSQGNVAHNVWLGLLALQHRGQEACGIYTLEKNRFQHKKQFGHVGDSEDFDGLNGDLGIGHVRYSTVGQPATREHFSDPQRLEDFAQPYFTDRPRGGIALCHNGNLVNFQQLCNEHRTNGTFLAATCDAEVILKTIANELSNGIDIETAIKASISRFEGAYSIAVLTGDGELIAFRDSYGFRPLCIGQRDGLFMFASESVALDINGINNYSEVQPGELIVARRGEPFSRIMLKTQTNHARCMFEYVYFSRPDSRIDERDVYSVRVSLGKNLAHTHKTHADVIVPVPDTARPAAEGISRETGIPVYEGLIKNRYIGRTFIMPGQSNRRSAVNLKLNAVRAVVAGKNVLLVDDSIVRGTTMQKIVKLVKDAGAKRVEVWVTCPPIKSPCFYGIDMATHTELVASTNSIEEIRRKVGADALCYQTINGLTGAIGFSKAETCLACLTGVYPTPLAQKIADEMQASPEGQKVRYWGREL
ncbi:MAG TPA: amidophosphoribosyltransferase [Terriglobales bacterium]|nr:amidophosphoribosyltransferase [Terriglobales bacterium]